MKQSKVTDHLGNEYNSTADMCAHYGILCKTYESRIYRGYSQERALTEALNVKPVTDHLGNEYNSVKAMCDHYGITVPAYYGRRKGGASLEDALTGTNIVRGRGRRENSCKPVTDHLGNQFASIVEMCRHYGVKYTNYKTRKALGWSLEECLTGERKKHKECIDHLGNKYDNLYAMCIHYGISISSYKHRTNMGWPLSEVLEGRKNVQDHLGNQYSSTAAMCKTYGITGALYRERIKLGWDQKDALTTPVEKNDVQKATDHLGNEYNTQLEMCTHYGIPYSTYRQRVRTGWSMKEALLTPPQKSNGKDKASIIESYKRTIDGLIEKLEKEKYAARGQLKGSENDLSAGLERAIQIIKEHYGIE